MIDSKTLSYGGNALITNYHFMLPTDPQVMTNWTVQLHNDKILMQIYCSTITVYFNDVIVGRMPIQGVNGTFWKEVLDTLNERKKENG